MQRYKKNFNSVVWRIFIRSFGRNFGLSPFFAWIAFILAKMGFVQSDFLIRYRSYAFLLICVVAAIITPPDVMTLILVAVPLYLLYEVSIKIIKLVERRYTGIETE